MSIYIRKAGILTTVQDLGRNGFRGFGINPTGAMDNRAARLINILLGNAESDAVVEMHFPAPVFEFAEPTIFALGGAVFGARLNNEDIDNWRLHSVEKGSILEFTEKTFGNRAYLAVAGGLAVEKWLASSSTNLRAGVGGFAGRRLQKNDCLNFNEKRNSANKKITSRDFSFRYKISDGIIPFYSSLPTVRVTAGAEFELLTGLSEEKFLTENFTVALDSDRMGFRLAGEPLYLLGNTEMISSAVDFGTVQLPPGGLPIILMADHQTSGGYPRIAHVASVDLPVLAQLGAGDKVNFKLISIKDAEDLQLGLERDLNLLKIGVGEKTLSTM